MCEFAQTTLYVSIFNLEVLNGIVNTLARSLMDVSVSSFAKCKEIPVRLQGLRICAYHGCYFSPVT